MGEKATYEVGKGKPPKHTRIGQPAGPPPGKTKTQKAIEMENAELAQLAKNRLLRALTAKQAEQSTDEVLASLTGSDILRLIKDAEDRAHGTPRQSVDVSNPDGSLKPHDASAAILAALERKHRDPE